MKGICFISAYPDDRTIRDGMMQRVHHVDQWFSGWRRTYLDIGITGNGTVSEDRLANEVTRIRLNAFLHRNLVCKHIRDAGLVYVHSLHNFLKVMPAGKPPGTRFLWDVHGLVGEELIFLGMPLRGRIFRRLERRALSMVDGMIHVTEAMKRHYLAAYPSAGKVRHCVFGTCSPNVFLRPENEADADRLLDLHSWRGKVLFVYSGNAQKWQNVDLMLERFAGIEGTRYHLLVLTGEPRIFAEKIRARGIGNCTVLSLKPSELAPYYTLAHYGFILRDDHVLNRVANPTKMVEYLYYGIVPVVKSPYIGDFLGLGYEYLSLDRLSGNLSPRKSEINRAIGRNMMTSDGAHEFIRFVESLWPA
jgi:hypothetical protein